MRIRLAILAALTLCSAASASAQTPGRSPQKPALPVELSKPPVFAPVGPSGYQEITFWQLAAFTYNPKEPWEPAPHVVPNAVPDWAKALNGKKVVIRGNATPASIDSGGVSEFFLANQTDPCGFGTMPRINEWIYVNMAGGKRVNITPPPGSTVEVLVKGVFKVKEDIEDNHIVSLFTLVADSVQ
jgi:hypothetical protein